ncbi:MAG: DpnD/PcfM family protein [Clostridium sp.]|nr:DpnD/PcfM family protein [Clostridium sp.]
MPTQNLFKITIEESISECFDVYASNIDEAIKEAEDKYKSGEFVLSPGEVIGRKILAVDETTDLEKGWIEF